MTISCGVWRSATASSSSTFGIMLRPCSSQQSIQCSPSSDRAQREYRGTPCHFCLAGESMGILVLGLHIGLAETFSELHWSLRLLGSWCSPFTGARNASWCESPPYLLLFLPPPFFTSLICSKPLALLTLSWHLLFRAPNQHTCFNLRNFKKPN